MSFDELKQEVVNQILKCANEVGRLDENANDVYDSYENANIELNGYDAIINKLEMLCDDVYALIDSPERRKLILEQIDDEDIEEEIDEEMDDIEEDEMDIEFNGVTYIDDEDEFDNFIRELDLLNQTIKIFEYDPYKNGIVIDNVNIEPGFGGVQVMGEITKIDNHENEEGFVTINAVFYEADEYDDAIRVLRKEVYDIDLEAIDSYSVFDIEIDLDPDTLDRTSGVNIYLSRQ